MTRKARKRQIEKAMTPAGGWTRETLRKLGVSWPPPRGWKKKLVRNASSHPGRLAIDYTSRNEALRSLGYPTYQAYLESPLWASIRKKVLARDGHCCLLCGSWATQVHHLEYLLPTLLGQDLRGMASICGDCHHHVEYDPSGHKRSPEAVDRCYRSARADMASSPLTQEFRAIVRGGAS